MVKASYCPRDPDFSTLGFPRLPYTAKDSNLCDHASTIWQWYRFAFTHASCALGECHELHLARSRPPALGETTEMTLSPLAPKSLSFFRPFAVCAQRLGGTTRQKAAIRPSECFGNAAPIRGRIPASLRKEYHESRCVPHIHPNAIVKNVMQHRPWHRTFQLQVAKVSST